MIKEYIEKWNNLPSPKPENDKRFINDFIEFMQSKDKNHYEFEGENYYCGFTATLYETEPQYSYGRVLAFEFAYGQDFVKVFTANHNGFWVPEYINLKGGEAAPILGILHHKLIEWAGFNCEQ